MLSQIHIGFCQGRGLANREITPGPVRNIAGEISVQAVLVIKTFHQKCMQVLMTDTDETMTLHPVNKYILFAFYV